MNPYLDQMKQDGFVFFRNLFGSGAAAKAHQELKRYYELDRRERQEKRVTRQSFDGSGGLTHQHGSSHVMMIDVYTKSPALDSMVEKILSDPLTGKVLEGIVGKNYKVRGYNVRWMSGAHDPAPAPPHHVPHEWHRDWLGELGIAILLTDVPEGGNSGTAVLPGSHLFPYCPRRNTLFCAKNLFGPHKVPFLSWLLDRCNPFSRLLGRRVFARAEEACGRAGDFFFFFNDTWHGRMPNLHGRQAAVVFIGLFPTEFDFPDKVSVPPAEVLAKLPAHLRQAVRQDAPLNTDRGTLMHWMLQQQKSMRPFSLFGLAWLERRLAEIVLSPVLLLLWLRRTLKPGSLLRRFLSRRPVGTSGSLVPGARTSGPLVPTESRAVQSQAGRDSRKVA